LNITRENRTEILHRRLRSARQQSASLSEWFRGTEAASDRPVNSSKVTSSYVQQEQQLKYNVEY